MDKIVLINKIVNHSSFYEFSHRLILDPYYIEDRLPSGGYEINQLLLGELELQLSNDDFFTNYFNHSIVNHLKDHCSKDDCYAVLLALDAHDTDCVHYLFRDLKAINVILRLAFKAVFKEHLDDLIEHFKKALMHSVFFTNNLDEIDPYERDLFLELLPSLCNDFALKHVPLCEDQLTKTIIILNAYVCVSKYNLFDYRQMVITPYYEFVMDMLHESHALADLKLSLNK